MSQSSVVFGVAIILQISGALMAKDNIVGEVQPCIDFLSYACEVSNSTELHLRRTFEISTRVKQHEEFIENYPLKVTQLSDVETKIYKFGMYCSNTTFENQKNFLRTFNPSVGGWPAFDKNWKAEKFDLQAALAELHSSFFPTILVINVQNDPTSFKNQIQVKLKMSDKLHREPFKQFMKWKLLNIVDNVDEVISDSVVVEALYADDKHAMDDDEDVFTDYKGLKRKIPEIDWDKQLETIYGQQVPDSFPVKINQLGQMKRIIPKIFEVEPKVMANYLLYRVGNILPDLNKNMPTVLFDHIVYHTIIKQHYSADTKEEVRGMLISFLTTLTNTVNLFGNEDKRNIEKTINELVMNEIVPDIDESYYDNVYKNVTVSEDNCYSTFTQFAKIYYKLKAKTYLQRTIDPLYGIKIQLLKTMVRKLHHILNMPSAIRFEVLTWNLFKTNFLSFWNPGSFNSVQQCLEKKIGQEFAEHDMKDVLQFKIFIKSYFDWAKDKADLIQLEDIKYGDSNKKILLELLMARYCYAESSQERSKISGVVANLKEFSDVYNCPVGSPLNPQSKCEFV